MSTAYEIRIEGHLDELWTAHLAGLSIRHDADGTTALTGPLADQSQLYGTLAALRDLGARLVSVRAQPDARRRVGAERPS